MSDPDTVHLERIERSIERRLATEKVTTRASWLFDNPRIGISNGRALDVLDTEIVYRLTDSRTVLIVLYRRRREARRSLSDSFAGISWFIGFLQRRVPEVQLLSTLVNVFPYQDERGISSERLVDFCTRCGGQATASDGGRWIHLEISSFVPLRACASPGDRRHPHHGVRSSKRTP